MVYLWFVLALLLLAAALWLFRLDGKQRARRDGAARSGSLPAGRDAADPASPDRAESDAAGTHPSPGPVAAESDVRGMTSGDAVTTPAAEPAPTGEPGPAGVDSEGTRSPRPADQRDRPGAASAGNATKDTDAADAAATRSLESDPVSEGTAPGDAEWTPPTATPRPAPFATGEIQGEAIPGEPSPADDYYGASGGADDADGDNDTEGRRDRAAAPASATADDAATPSTDTTARLSRVAGDAAATADDREPAERPDEGDAESGGAAEGPTDRVIEKRGPLSRIRRSLVNVGDSKGRGPTSPAAEGGAAATSGAAAARNVTVTPIDRAGRGTGEPTDEKQVEGDADLREAQDAWRRSRGFTAVAGDDAPDTYQGRFRGTETRLRFTPESVHISLGRPGPNATGFSLERTSSPADGEGGATIEQMTLRSDDETTDALLTDPRVVRALRAAPAEFTGATVDATHGRTVIPATEVGAYDGAILTLHAVVAAAAALPTPQGAGPLDLTLTDPGSAVESRGGDDAAHGTSDAPRVVDTELDSDVDAELDEQLAADLPPASSAARRNAPAAPVTGAGSGPGGVVTPDDVEFTPRKPGRPGHLRLVKTPDDDAAAESAGAGTTDAAAEFAGPGAADDDVIGQSDTTGDGAVQPNPFDAAMRADDVPHNRGDVAADFLPERPASLRPSRGTAASFGDERDLPTLGEPSLAGDEPDDFKALGASSEGPAETRESISEEVQRFERTRMGAAAPAEDPGASDADAEPADTAEAAGAADAVEAAGPAADEASTDVESGEGSEADRGADGAAGPPAPGRHRSANPNAVSIADLLARESGDTTRADHTESDD